MTITPDHQHKEHHNSTQKQNRNRRFRLIMFLSAYESMFGKDLHACIQDFVYREEISTQDIQDIKKCLEILSIKDNIQLINSELEKQYKIKLAKPDSHILSAAFFCIMFEIIFLPSTNSEALKNYSEITKMFINRASSKFLNFFFCSLIIK